MFFIPPDAISIHQNLVGGAFIMKRVAKRYVPNYAFAVGYTALGEKEQLVWLEKDVAERSAFAIFASVDPALDELREEPRFKEMLKRMNLQ